MKTIVLPAMAREVLGKKVKTLRKEEKLPAILYGHKVKNTNLTLDYRAFEEVYKEAGASSLIDLQIDKQSPIKVLVQDVQKDPVTDKYIHADFHQVKMTEKISTEVELKFVGESKAVKEAGGVLIKNLSAIKIECLPTDLVQEIEVNITSLETFDDIIRVKNIKFPTGITAKEKDDKVIVSVQPPRTEEELKSLEEKPDEQVEEVAKVGKEEPAEGEEPVPEEKPAEAKDKQEKPKE